VRLIKSLALILLIFPLAGYGFSAAAGSKKRTSYLEVDVSPSSRSANSTHVRTYDLRKSEIELEKFFNGEALAQELKQTLRKQAEAKFLTRLQDEVLQPNM